MFRGKDLKDMSNFALKEIDLLQSDRVQRRLKY